MGGEGRKEGRKEKEKEKERFFFSCSETNRDRRSDLLEREYMNEKKNQKIRGRDLKVALFIAEQGATRLSTITRYLATQGINIDPREVRRICERLENHQFLKRKQILTGSSVVWPTAKGLKLAGLQAFSGERFSNPSMELLLHSILVSEVRVVYESNGAEWICERKIRDLFPNHLPDGLVIYEGQRIIVEIDRTRKQKDRLITIMKLNIFAFSGNSIVDYWVTKDTYQFVNAQKQLLPEGIKERVRVFLLSEDLI